MQSGFRAHFLWLAGKIARLYASRRGAVQAELTCANAHFRGSGACERDPFTP
jgi:hypothetical protein